MKKRYRIDAFGFLLIYIDGVRYACHWIPHIQAFTNRQPKTL